MLDFCRRSDRRVLAGLLVMLTAGFSAAAEPVSAVRQILVLQSSDRGSLPLDYVTGNFRLDLERRAGQPVSFVEFVTNPAGFIVPPEKALEEFLRSAFAERPEPDLIVTFGGPAAAFARKYRQQLFPETPLLLAAVDERFLRGVPLGENETTVAIVNDPARLVDDILQLFPRTSQVFVMTGSGQLGKFWRGELERELQRFQGRLTFIWSDDLSLAEILKRTASLPPHSAIFHATFAIDGQGVAYATERVLADLHATANAPLFAPQSAHLGHGVVGGTLMSNDNLGRRTADVAIRILNGESPGSIRVPPQAPGPPLFDWRELRRWGIDESRLPPGSEVRFRGPSLWRDYRREVLGVLGALIVQSLLIVGLLYHRRARQRAEVDSRRNLALAADADRRVTMSALTGSIAHDLSQPLNSILHNAQAGEMLVASNGATPDSLREILSEIRMADVHATQIVERHRTMLKKHELDKKLVDMHAVVSESLALVAHDTKTRHVEIDVDLPSGPCFVNGDQVLLQQVVVNLVMNAMEAMTETPSDRRRVSIHGHKVGQDSVEFSVHDSGTGLPATLDGHLFEPFVTTKSHGMGIGLTIVRTIVEAHRGSMDAHNNPDGGATFRVTLPCNARSSISQADAAANLS